MRSLRVLVHRDMAGERGMTLVEVTIAALVSLVAAAIFGAALVTMQRTTNEQAQRSISNDQVRLAVQQLDREVRSGSILYDPGAASQPIPVQIPAGFSLQIYAPTADQKRCIQWKIEDRRLLRRTWTASFGTAVDLTTLTAWNVVAENVVNRDLVDGAGQPSPVAAFELGVTAGPVTATARTVEITMLVSAAANPTLQETVAVEQTLYGRNTRTGSARDDVACVPVPA